MIENLKITACIVGFNEAHYLIDCFKGLDWCTEIIYFDLGSTDNSVQIAKNFTNNVNVIERIPIVELVHKKYCSNLDCDLLVLTDPDEIIKNELKQTIINNLNKFNLNIHSEIKVDWYYFFKGQKLIGTYWGGIHKKSLVYNYKLIEFTGQVHNGVKIKSGKEFLIHWNRDAFLEHHWSNSWTKLFEKHKRYLAGEGQALSYQGYSYSFKSHMYYTLKAFYYSFWVVNGYKNGLNGLLLSLFWAWYNFKRWSELRKFEKK